MNIDQLIHIGNIKISKLTVRTTEIYSITEYSDNEIYGLCYNSPVFFDTSTEVIKHVNRHKFSTM